MCHGPTRLPPPRSRVVIRLAENTKAKPNANTRTLRPDKCLVVIVIDLLEGLAVVGVEVALDHRPGGSCHADEYCPDRPVGGATAVAGNPLNRNSIGVAGGLPRPSPAPLGCLSLCAGPKSRHGRRGTCAPPRCFKWPAEQDSRRTGHIVHPIRNTAPGAGLGACERLPGAGALIIHLKMPVEPPLRIG